MANLMPTTDNNEELSQTILELLPWCIDPACDMHMSKSAAVPIRDKIMAVITADRQAAIREARLDERKATSARLNKVVFHSTTQPDGQFVKDCILAESDSAENERIVSLNQPTKEETHG